MHTYNNIFVFVGNNLRQIARGDPVTVLSTTPGSAAFTQRGRGSQSPRHRPSSPSTPPCSPNVKINSPRSPRRSTGFSKSLAKQLNGKVRRLLCCCFQPYPCDRLQSILTS